MFFRVWLIAEFTTPGVGQREWSMRPSRDRIVWSTSFLWSACLLTSGFEAFHALPVFARFAFHQRGGVFCLVVT